MKNNVLAILIFHIVKKLAIFGRTISITTIQSGSDFLIIDKS